MVSQQSFLDVYLDVFIANDIYSAEPVEPLPFGRQTGLTLEMRTHAGQSIISIFSVSSCKNLFCFAQFHGSALLQRLFYFIKPNYIMILFQFAIQCYYGEMKTDYNRCNVICFDKPNGVLLSSTVDHALTTQTKNIKKRFKNFIWTILMIKS